MLKFGRNLLLAEIFMLVNFHPLVFQSELLGFEVWGEEHPAEDQGHAEDHPLGLLRLFGFGLVPGDEEEDHEHVAVGEEQVDPVLIALEGELLYLYVEIFLDEQILEIFAEVVRREDHQTFNFGPVDVHFWCRRLRLVGGGGRAEVELLEEGDYDGDEDEDVYGPLYYLRWVALIHISYICLTTYQTIRLQLAKIKIWKLRTVAAFVEVRLPAIQMLNMQF